MLTVAFAVENPDYDGEVYRLLLELLLDRQVAAFATQRRFSGWPSVLSLSEPFLRDADRQGTRHALFAIDNDGGSKRALEHEDTHDVAAEAADEDGCRVCLLAHALPPWWTENGSKRALVVPVQALETWLLCIRGDALKAPTPEQDHARRVLKTRFFGKPEPPASDKLALALAEVRKPHALDTLRQRRSFRHFEDQLAGWR